MPSAVRSARCTISGLVALERRLPIKAPNVGNHLGHHLGLHIDGLGVARERRRCVK
jgi:hypothetical protein